MNSNLKLLIPPPLVALAAGFLIWQTSKAAPQLLIHVPAQLGVAILVASVGLFIELTGVIQFFSRRTTVNPLKPNTSSHLITDGFYRFSRNPMYVGMMLLLLAWSVHLGALILGPCAIALAMWYLTIFQIKPEEEALETMFGKDYQTYKSQVRRWI